jgi:putative sterol carrier protein
VRKSELESSEPMEIYAAIAAMGDDEFDDLMQDLPRRELVIGALIDHMVGIFNPEKAEGVEASIHIKLWDRPGGGYEHYEMRIEDRACELVDDPYGEPDLTLKIRPTDLRKLIIGETGARRLALKGRLRVIGDLGLGMRLSDLFDF